jgi:2'-deoxynucleoside 5'-phosphate N-hydrolase
MKIYFAASIRGGREDVNTYSKIIEHLKNHGQVLTEHIADKKLAVQGEDGLTDNYIHERDLGGVLQSDVIVAEVTTPSLGVGYELGRAVEHGKRILCLYRQDNENRMLSAMIAGCPGIIVKEYKTIEEAQKIIDNFFKNSFNIGA